MATQNQAQDNNPNSGSTNSVANLTRPANQNQTAITGQKSSATGADSLPKSGKPNVLSKFSSYTYGITLYIVTPEAYNAVFTDPGATGSLDKTIPGVYIVAQSGGINNISESRALTFDGDLNSGVSGSNQGLDYYIDDLIIETEVPGQSNLATVSTDLSFKIIEPIGFKFLTDLAKASNAINNMSDIIKSSTSPPNSYQQKYILGVTFHGYDVNGNLVKASDPLVSEYNNGYGSDDSVIQRYYPIEFQTVRFKLGGGATVYNCEATIVQHQAGFGEINAVMTKTTELRATTVREAIEGIVNQRANDIVTGLFQILNEERQDLKDRDKTELAVRYSVEFEPGAGIDTAKILDDTEVNARIAPMASVARTQDATVSESVKSTTIDTVRKKLSVAAGTSIATIIDNIIVKSSYVSDALNQINSSTPETETDENPGVKKLAWYTINPIAKITGRDSKTNQWVYDIKYVIRSYKIPYIRTQYKQMTEKYFGPFKLYEYWLTGGNSEVIAYEQSYDNLYYAITPISTTADVSSGNDKQGKQTPTSPQGGTAYNNTGGKPNRGSEINNAVAAQLYSPADQAEASIKILGDPDFLMTQVALPPVYGSFYGRDLSIDPLNSQVFIQIVFNTASDYGNDGLLDVTDKIQFYSSNTISKFGIKGIVYQVVKVQSSFARGVFTQQLQCVLVPEDELVTTYDTNSAGREAERRGTETDPANQTLATQQRTGVDLSNASAGGGRGGRGGPTAQELAAASAQSARDDAKPKYETPYDRMNRQNREAAAQRAEQASRERETLQRNLQNGLSSSTIQGIDPRTLLPIRR